MDRRFCWTSVLLLALHGSVAICEETNQPAGGVEQLEPTQQQLRAAVARSLPLLEKASAGSADQRKCFTCHSQALPVLTLADARRKDFDIDKENFDRQIEHTRDFLERGKKLNLAGEGLGGAVDTVGYGLWTLEEADPTDQALADSIDELAAHVMHYILAVQQEDGRWKTVSNRPPSEASDATTTYLAVRALTHFGDQADKQQTNAALAAAEQWALEYEPADTEDRVFQLLTFELLGLPAAKIDRPIEQLLETQRPDGGWAQLNEMDSDAYATATVMYALHRAGFDRNREPWKRGIKYLIKNQHEDGSWHVESRSKPFQKYFETGFPYAADQFISTTATGWATIVLLASIDKDSSSR